MRRTAIVWSAAVLVAVSLTACSGGPKAPAGSTPAAQAVAARALIKKASDTGRTLRSAHLETTTVLAGKTVTITGDISYRPVAMQETVTVAGTTVQELLVGKAFYVKNPAAAAPGKPWVTISVAKMSKLIGIDVSSMLDKSRPDQAVQLLSASGDLKVVGTETVNGMATQHLRGTVDLDRVMTTLSASSSAYKSFEAMVKSAGVTDTHIELWVNRQNIPVKMTETYTSKFGAGSTTMTLTKLNQPVHIVAPNPSQVRQFPG